MIFSNWDTGAPITFKQDGKRFETNSRTLKFYSDIKYKCEIKCRPPVEFL